MLQKIEKNNAKNYTKTTSCLCLHNGTGLPFNDMGNDVGKKRKKKHKEIIKKESNREVHKNFWFIHTTSLSFILFFDVVTYSLQCLIVYLCNITRIVVL